MSLLSVLVKIVTARVEEIRDTVKKEDAAQMFTILKEETT